MAELDMGSAHTPADHPLFAVGDPSAGGVRAPGTRAGGGEGAGGWGGEEAAHRGRAAQAGEREEEDGANGL